MTVRCLRHVVALSNLFLGVAFWSQGGCFNINVFIYMKQKKEREGGWEGRGKEGDGFYCTGHVFHVFSFLRKANTSLETCWLTQLVFWLDGHV